MRPGSPVGSFDYRGRAISNIPGVNLDGTDGPGGADEVDKDDYHKGIIESGTPRGLGHWISQVVGRERAGSSGSSRARYTPLGQRDT